MNPSRTAALVFGALVAVPLIAGADKVQVVVVPYAPLYDSIPRATGERIAETLVTELGTVGVEVVPLPGEAATPAAAGPSREPTDEQNAAVEEAKAELERGKGLLKRLKVKPALDAFESAIAKMEGNPEALMNVDPLVEAHVKRAVALYRMGKEDVALKEAIPTAIRLKPSLTLEVGPDYAQVFVADVEKVRKQLFTSPLGDLRVDTTPPGAGVWVDDRESSTSPALARGLIPGVHYVRIKPPGDPFYVQAIEVKPNALARITPDAGAVKEGLVTGLVSHLSQNALAPDTLKQLKAVAAAAKVKWVIVGGAFAQGANMGIVSFVYSADKNALIEMPRVTLDREMLGATIEINKLANNVAARVPAFADPVAVPRPLASDAKAGEELVNEVDFTPAVPGEKKDERPGAIVPATPAKSDPAQGGGRRPVVTPGRRPVGSSPEPISDASGLEGLEGLEEAEPEAIAAAVVEPEPPAPRGPATADDGGLAFRDPAPAEDFRADPDPAEEEFVLDFEESLDEPVEVAENQENRPDYRYLGGSSIEDEQIFDPNAGLGQKQESGLLSKWWFWAGAAAVAGGVATVGALAGGGDDPTGAKGSVRW